MTTITRAVTAACQYPGSSVMTPEIANQILRENFSYLDTAAGLGGKDGLIGRPDLEAVLCNPDAPAGLKEACSYLLRNPAAFNQLDVAAGIGNVDGLIGRNDVDSFSASSGAPGLLPAPWSPGAASPLPTPSFEDLAAVQQQIQQAIQQAQGLRPASGVGAPSAAGGEMSPRDACEVLNRNFDKVATGKFKTVDKKSLQDVVASNWASPELKQAANTILNTPGLIERIGHAKGGDSPFQGDKAITQGDLNTVLSPGFADSTFAPGASGVGGPASTGAAGGQTELHGAADIIRRNFDKLATGKFKTVDKKALENAVASNWASPELKWACNQLLNNPAAIERLGSARRGDSPFQGDRAITEGDLNTFLSPGYRD